MTYRQTDRTSGERSIGRQTDRQILCSNKNSEEYEPSPKRAPKLTQALTELFVCCSERDSRSQIVLLKIYMLSEIPRRPGILHSEGHTWRQQLRHPEATELHGRRRDPLQGHGQVLRPSYRHYCGGDGADC